MRRKISVVLLATALAIPQPTITFGAVLTNPELEKGIA